MSALLEQPSAASVPATPRRRTRRALLAGALGGLGALVATAIGRVDPVRAGTDGDVVLGASNSSVTTTAITCTGDGTAFAVGTTGLGTGISGGSVSDAGVNGQSSSGRGVNGGSDTSVGVQGTSASNIGVYGVNTASNQPAMLGQAAEGSTGVQGFSGSGSAPAAKAKTGVYGHASQDASSKGVWGFSGRGAGLYGQANKAGFALRTHGRLKADLVSGVAGIAAGSTSVTLTPGVTISGGSFVLLTPKANIGSRGLWFTTNRSAGSITIHMSSTRSSATKIAWLLLG